MNAAEDRARERRLSRAGGGRPRRGRPPRSCPPRPRRTATRRTSRRAPRRRPRGGTGRPTRERPTRKPSARPPSRPCVDLDGARRRLEAVLVPVQRVRAGRDRAEDGSSAITVSGSQLTNRFGSRRFSPPVARASSCAPRQTPRNGISRATASAISSTSGASAGSHASCSPPKDTSPSRPSSDGSSPRKCSSTAPSGAAALPRKGCCRWWMTAMRVMGAARARRLRRG